jgi:hypothetical protein
MRRLALGSLLSFACFAYAQQQQIPQQQIPQQQIPQQQIPGDVYESGANAGTPEQAVQKLYELAAKMTGDPSSGYDAKTDHWPEADAAWQQWDNSIGLNGNALTQQQRNELVPCAAHLGAAIGDAERSYRIQKSQPNNPPAQADAQKLLGTARTEFEQCNPAGALNGSNDTPASGTASPGSPGNPLKGGVNTGPDGTPGTTGGGGPGTPQATGTQPASPASSSPGSGSGSPPTPSDSFQPTQDFRNKLLADAQTLWQNAGDISKAMSDRMNPATHNNVGVQVGLLSLAGAAGSMMGFAAKEFQLLAAASRIVQPASTYLQIADTAAAESGTLANETTQLLSKVGSAGTGAADVAADAAGYQEGIEFYPGENPPILRMGDLPTCGVLSCTRLAQFLGQNEKTFEILDKIKPVVQPNNLTVPNAVTIEGGLTMPAVAAGLRSVGINAQVESGIGAMMNQVRAGNPVIAAMNALGTPDSPWHAIVVEGLETRGTVVGLKIYDPVGYVYWQPVQTFGKYFTNIFVKPLQSHL